MLKTPIDINTIFVCINIFGILALLTAKIYFEKKFNNIIFTVLFIFFLIPSIITFIVTYIMIAPANIHSTFIQNINLSTAGYFIASAFGILISEIIIFPIIAIYTIVYIIKTKDGTILKKFGTIFALLVILLYTIFPAIIMPQNLNFMPLREFNINNNKFAADIAIIPGLKAFYAGNTALCLQKELNRKYKSGFKFPDYSSAEAQNLITEYLKYKDIETKYTNYSGYLITAIFCKEIENFDKALEYANKAKEKGINSDGIIASVYIAKKDYKTAYKYALKAKNPSLYLVRIYAGENKFDKALTELEKVKDTINFYNKAMAYIKYKTGKKDDANKYKYRINGFEKYTIEEFIKYMDRYEF